MAEHEVLRLRAFGPSLRMTDRVKSLKDKDYFCMGLNGKSFGVGTLACLGAVCCWTSGPVFIRLLTEHVDVYTQNLFRYLTACVFWLPFLFFYCRKHKPGKVIWVKSFWPAVINVFSQFLWASSLYYIDPGFMVLLSKSSTIWVICFSVILFADERLILKNKRLWAGFVLSVVGVVGVMVFKEGFGSEKTLTGVMLILAFSLVWAVYTISIKICFKDIDVRVGFSVISIYTVIGLGVFALLFGEPAEAISMGLRPWVYIVVSGVLSIAFAHTLFYTSIKRIGATIPSLVLLVTPFTTLIVSNLMIGESLGVFQWIFGIVLTFGCGLAVASRQFVVRGS